nr:MAG TPA: hypothetical protein [Bacteriophage sp.]
MTICISQIVFRFIINRRLIRSIFYYKRISNK